MGRAPRTIAHLLIMFAIANLLASMTHVRALDLVSHAHFLTLAVGVAVAANRARALGFSALALFLTGPLFPVACSLGAGLAIGLVLRETFGASHGQPVPDPVLPEQRARTAHGDAGPDRQLGDPFGIARTEHPPARRPARNRGDDDAPADRGRRPAF